MISRSLLMPMAVDSSHHPTKMSLCQATQALELVNDPLRAIWTRPHKICRAARSERTGERHASACRYKNGSSTNEVRGNICAANVMAPLVLRLSLKGSRISAWGKRIRECG